MFTVTDHAAVGSVGTAFLELLAREAAPPEFNALARALARDADPAAAAVVEAAKGLALRVRVLLARRERRDGQLTALFDTANDLASLQDLDAVLRSIAQRARRLLGSDVAYLSLLTDSATATYIRVADGSVSATLLNLQLPLGVGVGGAVARTGRTVQTSEYLADPLLEHLGDVDAAVADEGLVAVLGVPLVASGDVIGVLFAADRRERTFPPEEVALLASLATHAALAIEKTRLLQEATSALVELSIASETIRAHSRAVERAGQAHERLTELVLRGGGVGDVAESVVRVLGGTLVVLDAERRVLAVAGAGRVDDLPLPVPETSLPEASLPGVRSLQEGDWWLAPVAAGSERLGTLLLHPGQQLADGDRRVLERAAMVTALLLVWRRSVAEAEMQGRGDVLRDLLTGPADAGALRERARVIGVDLDGLWVVVVLRAHGERRRLRSAAARVAPVADGLVGEIDDGVVLVVPAEPRTHSREVAASVAGALTARLGTPVTAGGAGPVTGPVGVRTAYDEARRCVRALLALGRVGETADARDLGFLGVLLSDRRDVAGYLERTLGPVLEYDARRGSDLVGTLTAWFRHDRNVTRTAETLHVHPNTLLQRLERVGRLIGTDWRSADRLLEVQLALQLHQVAGSGVLSG